MPGADSPRQRYTRGMPPVRLSDDELDAVMTAARPLDPHQRDGFLEEVASALATCGVIGPGVVHRICSEIQRRYFDAPELDGRGGVPKYRR